MNVMSTQDWLRLTNAGALSVRSADLKAVDTALARYHTSPTETSKQALTGALLRWIQSKGADWKRSDRNRHQAVETLHSQLMGTGGRTLSGAERVALSHVRDEARAIVTDLFRGRRLEWRQSFKQKLANEKLGTTLATSSLVVNVNTLSGGAIASGARTVGSLPSQAANAMGIANNSGSSSRTMELAHDLIRNTVPPHLVADVTKELLSLMPDFLKTLAASMVPVAGVISAGGGALYSSFKLARGQYRLDSAREHIMYSLSTAEPAMAMQAIARMLERERNTEAIGVAIGVGEFGGKLAGALADGGTATNAAIGLAASVARLTNIIRIVARDVEERNEANLAMMTRVDATIFRTCPVVGAYLVCCAPTSVLVNTIFESRFGTTGWMGEVEHAVATHLAPLKEQAARLVREHRFVIPELTNYPGIVERNEKKLKEMMERKGKSGMVGYGSDDMARWDVPTRPRR